ncbi:Low-density lipoprotein receptor-related protein [Oopsacas minuta]|uniref:Low-density lipoprotein receptor-related protein n=1 Tax=Oopsacas minuta TaxID=111878 RepID=A0A2H4G8J4_9METZ|nr:Low-density lipoprotein receptor-related protein [Oopsacas minuta]KAI6657916.1 Low-density lipoprotein receptor-related protein [Oopsacas minuta]
MNRTIATLFSIFITLSLLQNSNGLTKNYNLILQTNNYFYSATFRLSENDTHPLLNSLSRLPYPISDKQITSIATCSLFLYYSAGDYIEKSIISNSFSYNTKIKTSDSSINTMAIDPYCRSLFMTSSSSLQISASNTSSGFLTPRILTSDGVGDNSINSISYDYNNYQLLYTTTQNEVYQLKFNSTTPNVLKRYNTQIINSGISHTHLYTLNKNSTHTSLWKSSLDQLYENPTEHKVWDNTEELKEFIITPDGEWLFYIESSTGKLAVISNTNSYTTELDVIDNITDIQNLLLTPDTTQPSTDPCLTSSCTHLCLPLSHSNSTCYCPNGDKQITQSPKCNTDLYKTTLISTDAGVYVLRNDGEYVSSSLLPLTGYLPSNIQELTAADNWIYWSENFNTNGIPYSLIRTSNTITGHTDIIVQDLLGQVSGLAVDRLSDTLFWCDRILKRIEVSRTNGYYRRVLFGSDVIIGAPSNLVTNLENSNLYWIEDRDGLYSIMSAPMDAKTDPQILVGEDVGLPVSLALDPTGKFLYWSDSNGVQRFDLQRRVLFSDYTIHMENISSISFREGEILSLKTDSLMSVFTGDSLLFQYTSRILAITTVNDDLDRTSPCRYGSDQLVCPHICLPSYPSDYTCMCAVGFELTSYNGDYQCEEIREALYFSQPGLLEVYQNNPLFNFRETSSLDIRIRSEVNATVSAVSSDVREGIVYWSNTHEGVVGRIHREGGDKQTVLEGYNSIQGLSFDALTRNLYWSDNSTGLLGVSTEDGSLQKVLLHSRNSIPFTLATNPRSGEIYYSTSASPHSIMSMYGNTGNVKSLVNVRGSAVALSVNANTNVLYWARNASIENQWLPTVLQCSLPDCTDSSYLLDFSTDIQHIAVSSDKFFSVASFPSSPDTHFLQKHYLPSGQFEKLITLPISKPGALHLSHMSTQPIQHICAVNNGGCSHLCLLGKPNSVGDVQNYVCECPVHMKLSSDQRNCELRKTYLIVLTEFYILALNKHPHVMDEAIPVGTLYNTQYISFDQLDNTVYWVNHVSSNNSVIMSFGLNRGEMFPKTIANVSTVESQLFSFQIDWVGKLAMWTRTDGNSIEFTRLDNTLSGYLFYNTTFQPRALAADPTTSRIFFSDWSSTPSISSINIDGNNSEIIVNSDYVSRPSSLVYSHRHNTLFWYDYDKREIALYNFTTQQVSIIHSLPKISNVTLRELTDMKIAITGDEIVWWEKFTDPIKTRFHYYNIYTRSTSSTDVDRVGSIYDMIGHTIDPEIHHSTHQCIMSGCRGICVNGNDSGQCTCPLYTRFDTVSMSCRPNSCPYVEIACSPGEECSDVIWRCDGIQDCIDGSDEINCTLKCNSDQFQCISNGICISKDNICDNISDCIDDSDESSCINSSSTFLSSTASTVSSTSSIDTKDNILLFYVIIALAVIIIILVCMFPLVTCISLWLMRPYYRRKTYNIPSIRDVENNSNPSSELEVRSFESTCPIIKPIEPPKHLHLRTPSSIIGTCSLNFFPRIQPHLEFQSPLSQDPVYGSGSFDIKTVDLVSNVTDTSLVRDNFDYEKAFDVRVPPPSVVSNYSENLLSVSQQDIPHVIESNSSDLTSHITKSSSQPFFDYAHPNSEISYIISSIDCSPKRTHMFRFPSSVSSHYTLITNSKSQEQFHEVFHH